MKTKDGKVVQILYKDVQGICECDDGWKRPLTELVEPAPEEVKEKRRKMKEKSEDD